jgi:phosphatidylserine decarboxylase
MDNYVWADPQHATAFPIARPGLPIIGAAAFVTAVFALLGWTVPTVVTLAATFFICWFFRDPDRVIPTVADAVVSPADGKVIRIDTVDDSPFYTGRCRKISIFMSVFNVHVNRVPYDGRIEWIRYNPGKFVSANLDKASLENEHNALSLTTDNGAALCFVQIAGLVARRIICRVQPGDRVTRGQRFGMICFGSRLDVYLPEDSRIDVTIGDRVHAGTSILGYLS